MVMGRKEIRQKQLLQLILEQGFIPSSKELAAVLNVTDRTIRNDLDEISASIPDVAVDDIRRMLMLRLRKRVPEMKDGDLLKLAEFFLSKKTESKVESKSEVKVDVGKEISGILKDYNQIIEEIARQEAGVPSEDGSGEPVDFS